MQGHLSQAFEAQFDGHSLQSPIILWQKRREKALRIAGVKEQQPLLAVKGIGRNLRQATRLLLVIVQGDGAKLQHRPGINGIQAKSDDIGIGTKVKNNDPGPTIDFAHDAGLVTDARTAVNIEAAAVIAVADINEIFQPHPDIVGEELLMSLENAAKHLHLLPFFLAPHHRVGGNPVTEQDLGNLHHPSTPLDDAQPEVIVFPAVHHAGIVAANRGPIPSPKHRRTEDDIVEQHSLKRVLRQQPLACNRPEKPSPAVDNGNLRIAVEHRHRLLQVGRLDAVIGIKRQDVLSDSGSNTVVSRRRQSHIDCVQHPGFFTVESLEKVDGEGIGRTVINHHDLEIAKGLRQDRIDRLVEITSMIITGNDYTDPRHHCSL